jgi:hypothetical protein
VIWTLPLIMIGFGKNGLLNSFRHDQDKTLFLSNANNFFMDVCLQTVASCGKKTQDYTISCHAT